jgi:hypothetical protein
VSDNLRRYRAILKALVQLHPGNPTGRQARHLQTLAGLISGIVGSRRVNLPAVAAKVPDGTKPDSRVKRFSRWLQNEGIDGEVYFLPYAQELLAGLADQTLLLAMDGSEVGRGCLVLMISVVYRKRALPLAWVVVKGTKGHFPEETHMQLLAQVQPLVPAASDVIFVGDGEFDGIGLQATVVGYGWCYVCRTAKNTRLAVGQDTFSYQDLPVQPGDCFGLPDVTFTAQGYGPVQAIAWWDVGHKEPIFLVTNLELVEEACHWYAKRYRIETFFSDQKSRGFHLLKSHISNPQRLARLLIAACLAYIWIIYLGAIAKRDGWLGTVHRTDRCDLSLFQLGLALLDHLLNECLTIPVALHMPRLAWAHSESVR